MPRWRSLRRSTTRSPPPMPAITPASCACGGASRTRRTSSRPSSSISPGEHEFRIWTAAGTVLRGAARVGLGRVDEGLADVRNGIGLYGELRSPPIFWPFLLFVQAPRLRRRWTTRRGADGGRSLVGHPRRSSGASLLPELWIAKGDLVRALAGDDTGDARRGRALVPEGTRARDRARRAHGAAPGFDPPRPAARRGRRSGRRVRLFWRPILSMLTEGFETADVREARDLLEAVATP